MIIRISNYVCRRGICRNNEAKAVDRDDDNVQNLVPNVPTARFFFIRSFSILFSGLPIVEQITITNQLASQTDWQGGTTVRLVVT